MSSSILSVNFAYADATSKTVSVGTLSPTSEAVSKFKERLKKFNLADDETKQKFTNLEKFLKSDNGAALTGIKSAHIVTSQTRRIYDAATYKP